MKLKLGNFKYEGERFYIDGKLLDLSTMRYKILKLLVESYKMRPVKYNDFMQSLYYDNDYIKDEPNTESFRVIIHNLRKVLRKRSGNKLSIVANKGLGYSLEYNTKPKPVYIAKLTPESKDRILKLHNDGHSTSSIGSQFGISRHRVYDILIRSKQDRLPRNILRDDNEK